MFAARATFLVQMRHMGFKWLFCKENRKLVVKGDQYTSSQLQLL
jgi:hypothetical protein